MTFNEFKQSVAGKNIAVIGIGVSNRPLIHFLVENGAYVSAYDKNTRDELGDIVPTLEAEGVKLFLGKDYLSHLAGDIIFKTPGLRKDVPEIVEAQKAGAIITSEMEVFFEVCPAHIIAITGSDGKTTTTTLTYKMLQNQGFKTYVGGNIGNPLLVEAGEMMPDDYVVLELSSFQLDCMTRSPERAAITNLSPNHLDWHKDYAEYIASKCNIFTHQKQGDMLVLNYDNEDTRDLGEKYPCSWFSKSWLGKGVCLKAGTIYRDGKPLLDISDIKIPGMHNVENYMTAIGLVGDLVSKDVIVNLAKTFSGVEHRIEFVRTLDGVKYYNSSIDSSPNRSINTLKVFSDNVVMIAGGKDKGIPYDALGPSLVEHVKVLILIGATSDKIEASLNKALEATDEKPNIKVLRASTYPEAVNIARSNAKDGDVVILSNASTSFDMFPNFMERGRLFKKLVNDLK